MRKKATKKTTARSDTTNVKKIARKKKAVQVKKKEAKSRVEKPFNSGTMSKSAFFGMLRSLLRRKSMLAWKPISKVRNANRVPYIGPNKRRKYSYICSECSGEFEGTSVAVHHKVECGTLTCFEDLPGFVQRLFVEEEGLILLCNSCHQAKHPKKEKLT